MSTVSVKLQKKKKEEEEESKEDRRGDAVHDKAQYEEGGNVSVSNGGWEVWCAASHRRV